MIKTINIRRGMYFNVPRADQSPFRVEEIEFLNEVDCKVAQYPIVEGVRVTNVHPLTWWLKDLKPIPLTDKIFRNSKFEKAKDGFCGWLYPISKDEKIRIVKHNASVGWNFPLYGHTCVPVNFVHELQDLIYVLGGKEMEVKF